jgi:hypothetical protein
MKRERKSFTQSDINSIRVMDKCYNTDYLSEKVANHTFSPSTRDRIFFVFLFAVLFFARSKLGYRLGGIPSFKNYILTSFPVWYGMLMFWRVKKDYNSASMITLVRREAGSDFENGQYSATTLKKLSFSLELCDPADEEGLTTLLKEIWDKAWAEPPTWSETAFISAIYALTAWAYMSFDASKSMFAGILKVTGY